MSEKPWPDQWPDPEKTKKATNPSVSQQLSTSTTAIIIAILVMGSVLITRSTILWLTTPEFPPLTKNSSPPISYYDPSSQLLGDSYDSCTLNFVTHEHDCHHLTPLRFERPLRDGRTTVRLTLDPFTTGYTGARFAVTYGDIIQGTTLNIGDSATNNGLGEDAGTQTNDAELQITNQRLIVYGNDHTQSAQTTDGRRQLTAVDEIIQPNNTIFFEIGNHKLWWLQENWESQLIEGPYLYALARQPDAEGPTNYDIYAAFNQVIDGSRTGRGIEEVTITLIPAK